MISIVICSINSKKFDAVCQNYTQLLDGESFEIIGIHDAQSLCEGYNRGIDRSTGEVLIFSHDDIEIISPDFGVKLKRHLQDNDVIGVVGTTRVIHGQWVAAGQPFVHGHIIYTDPPGQGYVVNVCGVDAVAFSPVKALDGLFLAMKKQVALKLKFDQTHFDGFDLYDMDFTFSAYLAGFRLAVCNDISIIHESRGHFGETWQKYNERFVRKYHAVMDRNDPNTMRVGSARIRNKEQLLECCTVANMMRISQGLRSA